MAKLATVTGSLIITAGSKKDIRYSCWDGSGKSQESQNWKSNTYLLKEWSNSGLPMYSSSITVWHKYRYQLIRGTKHTNTILLLPYMPEFPSAGFHPASKDIHSRRTVHSKLAVGVRVNTYPSHCVSTPRGPCLEPDVNCDKFHHPIPAGVMEFFSREGIEETDGWIIFPFHVLLHTQMLNRI